MKQPDRTEICNLEAERQVLGRLLLHNHDFWLIAGELLPEHFFLRAHRDIYEHLGDLIKENQAASPITLKDRIVYDINHQPAIRYLIALSQDPATALNLNDYAMTIIDLSVRRDIVDATQTIVNTAQQVSLPLEKVVTDAELTFARVRHSVPQLREEKNQIATVCEEAVERLEYLRKTSVSPHPSIGIKEVTRHIGHLSPGCLYVLAGRPGSGKTAAAVAAARSIMRQKGPTNETFGVGFFTLEITKYDLWNRFIACEMALSQMPVYYMELKRGSLSDPHFQAVKRFSKALERFSLSIFDKSGVSVDEIYVEARALKQRLQREGKDLHVLVIDYLQIIKPSGRYRGNKTAEISEISSGLLQLAKDLEVAVIAVSQLSRKVEERADKRPIMPDLRESGQIEQDANSIIFLYRPAYYDLQNTEGAKAEQLDTFQARQNDLEYIIAKSRDGTTGRVVTYCEIGKNHITEKSLAPRS